MSMVSAFKDELCAEFTSRVTEIGLHTGDPGTDGANDSAYDHEVLDWSDPRDGIAFGTATFTVTGMFVAVGMWGGVGATTFRGAVETEISFTAEATLTVMLMHRVGTEIYQAVVNQ